MVEEAKSELSDQADSTASLGMPLAVGGAIGAAGAIGAGLLASPPPSTAHGYDPNDPKVYLIPK